MESIQKEFDLIVVGAGTGGSTAARFAAKKGLKVCLIDRKEQASIGDKICGDAVGTDIFDFLNINHPKGDELSCHINGAKLYPPNLHKCIELIDPKQAGYVVNRLEFGQRLLNEALDAGVAQFLDNTMALDLNIKNKMISGLKIRLSNGEKTELKSRLLIDASGFYSPLRRKIPSDIVENDISNEDAILCYREIVQFSANDLQVNDPEYIKIILNKEKAPGGYIWYFPKSESSLNIGIGAFMNLKGKVKELYQKNVFNEFIQIPDYEIISSGGGVAPIRRPLWSCADNGIMFVGDSACHVNPLHGGGIDPSMRAGYHAALVASEAIENSNYSIKLLWDYNHRIMTSFGAEFASLDLLRMGLQSFSNEELNFGLESDLLSAQEILEIASSGGLNLSLSDMLSKAIKGISRPNFLLDLNYLRIRMKEIFNLYKKFPRDIDNFRIWQERVIQVHEKFKKMLINPGK